jgi:hypothetical protein
MELKQQFDPDVSTSLLEAIRSFPVRREVEHCGARFSVPGLAIYADCPRCGTRIKVRSFSGAAEVEDVFDAVLEWLNQPGAEEVAQERRRVLAEDPDE